MNATGVDVRAKVGTGAAVVVGAVLVQAGLLTTAVLTTNPDYNFPGVVELLLIGVACVCIALSLWCRAVWEHGDGRIAALLVLLVSVLGVRYLFALGDPANLQAVGCLVMPGFIAKTECLLQLPFWTNYGLRQLLMHVTAMLVFWATAALARMAEAKAATFAPLLLLTPLIFAASALAPKFVPGMETLAGWNFVLNEIGGTARGSGLTSNPGWLWPLLAAPGALAVGLLASRSAWRVLTGGLVLAVILIAVGDAGQRGGYLLLLLLLACAGIYLGGWRVRSVVSSWRRRTLVSLGLMAGAMAAVVVAARHVEALMAWLGQFPLFAGFGAQHLVLASSARAAYWRCAWDNTWPVFWTGNGYASWLRVGAAACTGERAILDTAHNLWVQMFFEYGIIHAAIAAVVIMWLLFRAVAVKTRRPLEIEAATLSFLPVFLLVTAVQEIDYVPATYYAFASIGGYLWGSSRNPLSDGHEAPEPVRSRRVAPVVLFCLGICAFVASASYARSISWGGYTYAPVDVPGFKFSRWFRPDGAIAATSDGSAHPYSVFPFAMLTPELPGIAPDPRNKLKFVVTKTGITVVNGTDGWPRQYRYSASAKVEELSRLNAFAVFLPPLQADFMLLAEDGTSQWEVSANGISEKWCRQHCSIDFTEPWRPYVASRVWVYVEQPCVSEMAPARVHYLLDLLTRGQRNSVRAREGEVVFTEPSKPQAITLPLTSISPEWWRLTLETKLGCEEDASARGRSGPGFTGVRVLLGREVGK